jgi:two-component system response regulator HydG
VERAVILARGELVEVGDLPEGLRRASPPAGQAPGAPAALVIPPGTPMEEVERLVIRETLRQTRGDKTLAAQILGIAPRTIYRKLDRDGSGRLLDPPDGAPGEPGTA